jgi:prepilin-type processing-associated H-X9-DG protein
MADSPVINRANFIVVLILLLVLGSLGAMYLQRSRQFARRTTCQDHLRKVAEGLQNYEQAHGHYLGERMAPNFGYRIPLLPFIGEQKLHDQILESLADVKEFHDFLLTPFPCPTIFRCPSQIPWQGHPVSSDHTGNFFISLGQGVPEEPANGYCGSRSEELVDGVAHTIALAEFLGFVPNRFDERYSGYIYKRTGHPNDMKQAKIDCFNSKATNPHRAIKGTWAYWEQMESTYIHAMTPNQRQCVNMGSPSSDHGGGVNVVFADGAIRFIQEDVDPKIWWAWASRAGDSIGPP